MPRRQWSRRAPAVHHTLGGQIIIWDEVEPLFEAIARSGGCSGIIDPHVMMPGPALRRTSHRLPKPQAIDVVVAVDLGPPKPKLQRRIRLDD